ncbi:hypothetical protein ACFXP3_33315 [Streptomyces sp. NPDC059096]|uniref:hypothetical protein n=1 Tax=Streptomyces sp. NPDC059096 TaxID=3346727 RepID=UPI0036A4BB17
MPGQLVAARLLLNVLFGATLLGGLGIFLTAVTLGAVDGTLIGAVGYAAVPGVAGWLLARQAPAGGIRGWWGLVAVQVWLVLGALSTIGDGSGRGFTQLLLPVVILALLSRVRSREWFALAEHERAGSPPFSLSHMIRWRRDRGQTALEYLGLVLVVVAVVGGLVLGATRIGGGVQARICSVLDLSCASEGTGGDDTIEAHGAEGDEGDPGGATGGTGGAAGGTEGATGGTGGATGGTSGTGGGTGGTGGTSGGTADVPVGSDGDEAGDPTDPYEPVFAPGEEDRDGGGGDDGDRKPDCSGFWGCAWDYSGQVLEGLFVDGIWGDVTDLFDTVVHPVDTFNGILDYGRSLGDTWSEDSEDASGKWGDGDYLGALGDWAGASLKTGGTVLDDMFIGDDVRETWNRGEKTQAVTNVVWNIGSLFIPGYDAAKVAGKTSRLGKLGKLTQAIADGAEKAKGAANAARRAAGLGDSKAAREAADEARRHADEAERKAEEKGACSIALGGARLVPYGGGPSGGPYGGPAGVAGSGTGVLAAPRASVPLIVLAEGSGPKRCEGAEAEDARDAREEADDADRAAEGAELGDAADRAKRTILDARDKQKTPRNERFTLNEGAVDKLTAKAKDTPDLRRGEFGKDELAAALNDLSDMLGTKGIDNQSRGALGATVLKANDRHQLAEAMAEVRAARRAADLEAAPGTKVYAAVGKEKGRQSVDFGDGTTADLTDIDDADVVYRGKDGTVNVVEVKNTANATTQASLGAQAKKLGEWAREEGANPPRAARYEIQTGKDWDKIFNTFQKDKKTGTIPEGTPARTLAENGLGARIAGQDLTPEQLTGLDAAWNAKSPAEKQAARDSGRMKDPKSAMEYLGVS